ncbi:hypothetical protein M1M11_23960 [Pseudomonas azerbaijanoccidens]|uniref:hypothetical protein n=1 Tax=Pseudomonas azerbaijanoccidentalis TaxID=2842347 RepID=UPI00200B3A1A|nr:hypothetical protein [Pseudomonas azerbaijanoccidentalis]MCK8667941.1 hypothetical protein [Pseudomonas azerbaijanoccidentalis]
MSTLNRDIRTQIRVNAALDMIEQADGASAVRFTTAYAIGYINALHDERRISLDGALLYRADAHERRDRRLTALDVELGI